MPELVSKSRVERVAGNAVGGCNIGERSVGIEHLLGRDLVAGLGVDPEECGSYPT